MSNVYETTRLRVMDAHMYIYSYMYACMYVCIYACMCLYVCACMYACMRGLSLEALFTFGL